MKRLVSAAASAVVGALVATLLTPAGAVAAPTKAKGGACTPSPVVLKAAAVPVAGLSTTQVDHAVAIINAGAAQKVSQHGQTLAVMSALQSSDLGADPYPAVDAASFYRALTAVPHWQDLPPTLAAHAAVGNLNPQAFARYWSHAVTVVNALTSGTGAAGLRNLAARAQAIADCTAVTVGGQFGTGGIPYVGRLTPPDLVARAESLVQSGDGWHNRCQHFVAVLEGASSSGFSTALDAWQTFLARGEAHPVTSVDGTTPPVGAWLYYNSSNPAGHVVVYLGGGKVASTDVFGEGTVGIGPARALTDGPWHLQYLGWAAPWGGR